MTSRRDFFVTLLPVAGAMLFNARQAHAQAAPDLNGGRAVGRGRMPDPGRPARAVRCRVPHPVDEARSRPR